MTGYSATVLEALFVKDYVGCVKTGNKITFAIAGTITGDGRTGNYTVLKFNVPYSIGSKLFPHFTAVLGYIFMPGVENEYQVPIELTGFMSKWDNTDIRFLIRPDNVGNGQTYYIRAEFTFLLSDSLV